MNLEFLVYQHVNMFQFTACHLCTFSRALNLSTMALNSKMNIQCSGPHRAAAADPHIAAVRVVHAGRVARRREPGLVQQDGAAERAEEEGQG